MAANPHPFRGAALVILWLLLMGGMLLFIRSQTRTVAVYVTNRTTTSLEQLAVRFTGGESRTGRLLAGDTVLFNIRTTAESDLELQFAVGDGAPLYRVVGHAIAPGDGGRIEVEITSDLEVLIRKDIARTPLW